MPKTVIATLFNDESAFDCPFPQVGGNSNSPKTKAIYLRCMAVSLWSSKKVNPDAEHIFFTNRKDLPEVDGFSLQALLDELGVKFVTLPFNYMPPVGYYKHWNNTWFLYDIIEHLGGQLADDDVALVNDCDVVYINPSDRIVEAAHREGALTYDLDFPMDQRENGLTGHEIKELYAELGVELKPTDSWYYGSDFFIATGKDTRAIAAEAKAGFDITMKLHEAGKRKFNEEAHLLSFIYAKLGYRKGTANPFMRRMWTGSNFRDVVPGDYDLDIWHMPAEKKLGFRTLYGEAVKGRQSKLWNAPHEEYKRAMSEIFGIPSRSPAKQVRDFYLRAAGKVGVLK